MNLKSKVIMLWEENLTKARNQKLPDICRDSCAYCQKYYNRNSINFSSSKHNCCSGCPIAEVTQQPLCRGTPYYLVLALRETISESSIEHKGSWDTLTWAITTELEFLYSLPEDQEESLMSLKNEAIKHWEENLERVLNDQDPITGPDDCAYCREYVHLSCEGCPIFLVTGEKSCKGTPYPRVLKAAYEEDQPALIKAVKDEIKFLRSLPED